MVLILDNTTYDHVFSLLQKSDILRIFSVVARIDSSRVSQTSLNALYLLEPTNYSLRCLLADFEVPTVRYKGAHLHFLPTITPDQVNFVKSNHQLASRILSFGNFPIDLKVNESNVFTTGNPQSLQIYYNKCCSDLVAETIKKVATSLVGLCVLTGEYPVIRYYSRADEGFDAAVLPKMISTELQLQLDEYCRKNPDFPPSSERPRSIFIITDRTCDLFSPLLHEFTYQAMTYDLLEVKEDNTFKYEVENESGTLVTRTAKLDEQDPQWTSLKNLHISDAEESWKLAFKEFTSKYSKFIDRSGKVSVSDIRTLAAGTDEFNDARRRIVLHDKIITSLLTINNERSLAEMAEFEQDLANDGCDMNGDKLKSVASNLLHVLKNQNSLLSDKVRVLMLYGLYREGLVEQDFIKLFHFIGIPNSEFSGILSYFENLSYLGFALLKKTFGSRKLGKKSFFHESVSGDVFNTSRFKPAMSTIISHLLENKLDESTFPYIKDKPMELEVPSNQISSLKNPKHRAAWGKRSHAYEAPKQRIFYFIAGGATFSELRTAYELSSTFDRQIILGCDELLKPETFLENIKSLSTPDRNRLRLFQDWKRHYSNQPAPKILFQSAKDETKTTLPTQKLGSLSDVSIMDTSTATTKPVEKESKDGKRSRFKRFLKG